MKLSARMGGLAVGDGYPVRVMAAVNASPESFYKGSVARTPGEAGESARAAVEEGADVVDIGGASTAPYLSVAVTVEVERERVVGAVKAAADAVGSGVPLSVDTVRAPVAEAALRAGATAVNDVSGLKNDPAMAGVVRERGASLFAMAHSRRPSSLGPIPLVKKALAETLALVDEAGVDRRLVVLDPGIGFFRGGRGGATSSTQTKMPWYDWDCEVIARLPELRVLGRPVGVGLSRKSFIGKVLGLESPEDRLAGSLAAAAVAVVEGASLVRTHDVRATVHAVRTAEAVVARGRRARRAP